MTASGARTSAPTPARLSASYYPALTMASTSLWAMILGPVLSTIPSQVAELAPQQRIFALAMVTGIGGVVGIVGNPLIGRLSDATRSRLGRRRPWIIAGLAVILPASLTAGNAGSLAELVLWWSMLQLGANMLMAPLTATIPDLVPVDRRGVASACLGISWAVAPVLGTAVQAFTGSARLTYPILAAIIATSHLLFLLTLRGDRTQPSARPDRTQPSARPKSTAPRLLRALPQSRDFSLAWIHRFLFALGQNAALSYLFYYLQDVIRYERLHPNSSTDEGVLILTAIYTPCVIIAALTAGTLADRTHRHKVYIVGATIIFAGGAFLGAFTGSWNGVLVLAALTGIGFGAYEAVSMAMVIQLLPDQERRARDLSLINVATLIAIAIGPAVAAGLISLSGYVLMFVIAGISVLASGAIVVLIRATR
ncbi:MFS transporter [Phytoactinopolyspora limicola]|uniref:MFS transporter n=1 Tax=Phytoactinopolyspora limicola TaxID=2715536 RepID=UPI0014083C0B|nr:MFS transporter [Phytoactinopolyspora limicola]